MIAHLLQLNAAGTRYVNMIKEIWTIDMPNHGESAVLNRTYLEDRRERGRKEGWDGKCSAYSFLSSPIPSIMSLTMIMNSDDGLFQLSECLSLYTTATRP